MQLLLVEDGVVMWSAETSWLRHKLVRSIEDSPFAPLARDCSLSERAGQGLAEVTLRGLLESPFFGARFPDRENIEAIRKMLFWALEWFLARQPHDLKDPQQG